MENYDEAGAVSDERRIQNTTGGRIVDEQAVAPVANKEQILHLGDLRSCYRFIIN